MASNLQVIVKHFKASVNNVRLVAESLLSSASKNQYTNIHNGQFVLLSDTKLTNPQIERNLLPNKFNLAEMKIFATKRSHDINAQCTIVQHLLQAGFPANLGKSYEEIFVVAKVQGFHNNCSRKENVFAMNNAVQLTNATFTFRQFQSNIRTYSTEKQKDPIVTSETTVHDNKNEPTSGNRKEKLKKAMKEYGSTVVIFYIGLSLISFSCFYLLVSSGLDIVAILQHFGWENSALSNKLAAGASTAVVAYAIHMLFASLRISVTLAATPFIVRHLRNKGFLKKPTVKK